jgi:hypothetical protein
MPCPSFARQSAALCKQSNDTGSRPEIGWPPAPVWQASRMACAARIQNIENNPMQSSLAQHFRGPTPIEAGATGLPLPLAGYQMHTSLKLLFAEGKKPNLFNEH